MTTAEQQGLTHRERLERALIENDGPHIEDLYASWEQRRGACPVERVEGEERSAFLGYQQGRFHDRDVYVVWSHGETGQVMRDADHFWKPGPGGPMDETLLAMNGAEHRAFRDTIKEAFAPASIARWEQTLIEPLMHRLVDQFAPDGHADLVRDYTSHFPFHVIRVLLGFPDEVHDEFIGLAYPQEEPGDRYKGTGPGWEEAVHSFIQPYVTDARRDPQDNLLGTLVQAEVDGRRLTDRELHKFMVLMIIAGADTTFAGSGNMWCALLSDPTQLDLVRREPRLLTRAADEALRWNNSAATTFLRVASTPTSVGGVDIPAEAVMVCHLSSHNRDEHHYDDPDRYDLTRPRPPSGIFGYGPHACVGMHLARSEMKTSLRVALSRLPNLRLDPETPRPQVRWGVSFFAAPRALPVLFDPEPLAAERP